MSEDSEYSYRALPLTAAIAEELIPELFGGRTATRQQIATAVAEAHQRRGGAKAKAGNISQIFRIALQKLKKKNRASNPTVGNWRITQTLQTSIAPAEPTIELEATLVPPEVEDIKADKTIGQGASSVYVYFLPTYEAQARSHRENRWLCKIGRSDQDPLLRILSQAGTAIPEKPKIALIIRTDDPSSLEAAIHSILRLRSQWSGSSPGKEWFQTNPEEIESIVNFIGIE
jgi:T5orf172 domain